MAPQSARRKKGAGACEAANPQGDAQHEGTRDKGESEDFLASAQALLLFEDRGLPSWHETWCDMVKAWLARFASPQPPTALEGLPCTRPSRVGLLVMMAEQTDKSGIATIEADLQNACAQVRRWCPASTRKWL